MVGIVEQPSEDLDDRRSQHSVSTVATTTSLASRIAALNCDFGDKLLEGDESQIALGKDGDIPEEAADAVGPLPSELAAPSNGGAAGNGGADGGLEDALRQLAGREPPLQVCSRLFVGRSHPPIALKRLSMMQVEDFRQHGYVVVDGLVPREAAARLKAEALRLAARGKFTPAASGNSALRTSIEASSRIDGGAAPAGMGGRSPVSAATGAPATAAHPVPSRVQQARQPGPHKRQQHHHPQQQQQQGSRPGEQRLPLQLGAPPADTAPFAALLAALQEVQDDLHEFMRLRQRGGADYALALLPAGGASVPRRRDALPDDGCGYLTHAAAAAAGTAADSSGPSNGGAAASPSPAAAAAAAAAVAADPSLLRRVSILVFLNPIWERDSGGCLRLWPPQRQSMLQQGGGGGATPAGGGTVSGRRSPTSSDAGTTFSEGASECSSSLRLHHHLGSTTSSVIAEAASAVADPADAASLDGRLSLADSDVEAGARCCGFEWVEAEDGMALDVAPVAGRAVLMLAGAVDHALLAPATGAGDIVFARAWCT